MVRKKEPFESFNYLQTNVKEIETLKIDFFENLKEKQKNNVISNSKKFGVEDKTIDYIIKEHKILYYRSI